MRRRMSAARWQSSTSIAPPSKLLVIESVMMFPSSKQKAMKEPSKRGGPSARRASVADAAAEDIHAVVRRAFVETIAFGRERLERLGRFEAVFDHEARHQAARPFRVKADHLVASAFPIFEYRRNDRRFEALWLHRLEVFLRRAIDKYA